MDMISRYGVFCKVAEQKNFTKVASDIGYSQSAVSQIIKNLEKELGTTLISRRKDGVSLTKDGMEYLPYIQSIYLAEQNLQTKHREMDGLENATINICALSSIGRHILPYCMRSFKQQYPNVNFVIKQGDYNDTYNGIMDGTLDFGFTIIGASPDLENVPLYSDKMMAILPLQHPLANEKSVTFSQLAADPFILSYEGEYLNILNKFMQEGVTPDVQYKVYDDYSILSMVKKGLGISVLYKAVLKDVSFDLSVVPIEGSHSRTISLAYRNWDTLPVAARRFARYVIDHAAEIFSNIEM
ncbi:MAG: LysR family transcriptional regulator [Oscillospiraceae bacterium]|nr:LysR family transcriptional regulator [Oscillospiraceae bacterium]